MRLVPEPKISVPELPPRTVHRLLLRRELDQVGDVGLVCAPAGYGKTLLLAEWVQLGGPGVDTAWVRLDRDDDDPRLLWSALLTALGRCRVVSASSPVRVGPHGRGWDLSAAGRPEFVAELAAALATVPEPIRLVLDDVHEVTEPAALHGIAALLRDRPRQVRMVLAGRYDPPLGLQRLRPEGRLVELRTDRLRFDREEAETLLRAAALRLTPGQLDRLYRQTDGWPAGLRLAATAMSTISDVDGFLDSFSGDDRSVADYLVGEVLTGLPEPVVDLLQVTSICQEIPVPLAVALTGREDAGRVLTDLDHRTALVRPHGRTRDTYRMQPLIRGYLLADLNRRSARRRASLHGTAARWWLERGRPVTALEHAARADEPPLLTDAVRRLAVPLLVTGQHRPLRGALQVAGESTVADDPWFSVVAALVSHQVGDRGAAEAAARRACHIWPDEPPPGLALLRTIGEHLGVLPASGGPDAAGERALPPDLAATAGFEALLRVARCAAQLRSGVDVSAARHTLRDLSVQARAEGWDYVLLQCGALQAAAAAHEGDLHAMREFAADAVALAYSRGWTESPLALEATAMLGRGALLAADPQQAHRLAAEGLSRAEGAEPRLRFALLTLDGAASADLDDRVRGLERLQHARALLGHAGATQVDVAAAATAEFDVALRLGHHAAAQAAQSWLVGRAGETGETLLMRARSEALVGRVDQARATVQRVVAGQERTVLVSTTVDALLLTAELAVRAEDRYVARHALHEAVGLAEPGELLRPFVQAGPAVHGLLAQHYGSLEAADTLPGRALVRRARDSHRLDAVLSSRELTVLEMLPSLESLEEIAADLTVSVNTVKSHVRSIYSKLGVSSRRGAVLSGYEHGLIHHIHAPSRPPGPGPAGGPARSGPLMPRG